MPIRLAADLAERIRANPAIARLPGSYPAGHARGRSAFAALAGLHHRTLRNARQAAACDLSGQQQQVAQALPGARIQVCANANPVDARKPTGPVPAPALNPHALWSSAGGASGAQAKARPQPRTVAGGKHRGTFAMKSMRRPAPGFTLIELLVALALGLTVIALASSGLLLARQGMQAVDPVHPASRPRAAGSRCHHAHPHPSLCSG